jgi:hypothetical protein
VSPLWELRYFRDAFFFNFSFCHLHLVLRGNIVQHLFALVKDDPTIVESTYDLQSICDRYELRTRAPAVL